MEQGAATLTWRLPGEPLHLVRGHPEAVSELFTVLAGAGAVDLALSSETDAEGSADLERIRIQMRQAEH